MDPVLRLQQRLRLAGYTAVSERPIGSTWIVELSGAGQTIEVTGETPTVAWQRALRTVESLGVMVPTLEEDDQP